MDAKYIKFSVATSSTLLDGLISYWKLDESSGNATDSAGSNTGTNTSITYSTTGKINTCYTFNGSTSKVDCGDPTNLRLTTQGTLSAWVYASSISNNVIVSKGDWGNDKNGYTFVFYDGYLSLELADASSYISVIDSNTFTLNTWTHVVATWDSSNAYLYKNGSSVGSSTNGKTMTSTGKTFYIGFNGDHSAPFSGNIDEVGVWNRKLTSSEITELYNSGSGKAYPFS